jgi:hypothetical protein
VATRQINDYHCLISQLVAPQVEGDVHALLLEVAYDGDVAFTDEDINMHNPAGTLVLVIFAF